MYDKELTLAMNEYNQKSPCEKIFFFDSLFVKGPFYYYSHISDSLFPTHTIGDDVGMTLFETNSYNHKETSFYEYMLKDIQSIIAPDTISHYWKYGIIVIERFFITHGPGSYSEETHRFYDFYFLGSQEEYKSEIQRWKKIVDCK